MPINLHVPVAFLVPPLCRFSARFREYKYLIAYQPPAQPSSIDAGASEAGPAAEAEAAAGGGAPPPAGSSDGAGSAQQGGAPAGQQQQPRDQQAGSLAPALDVARMREAAEHFRGEHDFRNFCKVSRNDPS